MSNINTKLKKYNVKIYSPSGTFLKNINPDELKSIPNFKSQINAGYGDCTLDLNWPFDDAQIGTIINADNLVKIYLIDENHQEGILIYTGVMSQAKPYASASSQGVQVTVLGLNSFLTRETYRNGSNYSIAHSAVDPEVIFQDILDKFDADFPNILYYDGPSIATVGTNVSYTFVEKDFLDAITETYKKLVGSGYFWRLESDGKFTMQATPNAATHTFTFGKDVDSIETKFNWENIINRVHLKYNNGSVLDDSDATSISNYGIHAIIKEDNRITLLTTAEQYNDKILEAKDVKITGKIVVNSSYDIESVKVGETCKVRNIKQTSGLSDNMLIVGVTYDGDQITIDLGEIVTDLATEIDNLINPTA